MAHVPMRRLLWKELGMSKEEADDMDYRDLKDTMNALTLLLHREAANR